MLLLPTTHANHCHIAHAYQHCLRALARLASCGCLRCACSQVDVGDGKTAVCIFVPVPQLGMYQKLIKENGLIEELQKKFSGKGESD